MRSLGISLTGSRAPLWAGLVFVLGLGLTAWVGLGTWRHTRERDEWRFHTEVAMRWELLESSIEKHEAVLRQLQSFVESSLSLDPQEFTRKWESYTERLALHLNYPGWVDVGYARAQGPQHELPHLKDGTRQDFTGLARSNVQVMVTHQVRLAPVPDLVGTNLNGFGVRGNKSMTRSELWKRVEQTQDQRAEAILNARSHFQSIMMAHGYRRPYTTVPFRLHIPDVSEPPIAFRMFVPVYSAADLNPAPGKPRSLTGVVFGTMVLDRLMAIGLGSLHGHAHADLAMDTREYEPDLPPKPHWAPLNGGAYWNRNSGQWMGPVRPPPVGGWTTNFVIHQYRRPWRVNAYATKAFTAQSHQPYAKGSVFAGFAITVAMSGLVWIQVRREEEASRLASRLAKSEAETRAAAGERARFGRELHDRTLQSLFTVGMSLQDCRRRLDESHPGALDPKLADQLDTSLSMVRETSRDLRQFVLLVEVPRSQPERFIPDLEEWMKRVGRATNTEIHVRVDPSISNQVKASTLLELGAVIGECVSNAIRHGRAGRIEVGLTISEQEILLVVEDDGLGFDASETKGGNGLRNLRTRAEQLSGLFEVDSSSRGPTTARLSIPKGNRDHACP